MKQELNIEPASGPVDFSIRPPGSKSLSNRAMICAAMARGTSRLSGLLDSEDTRVMFGSLGRLGIQMRGDLADQVVEITGCEGVIPRSDVQLDTAGSGTTMRFLTATLAMAGGRYRLDGIPRMRQRPIGPLLDALQQLGLQVSGSDGRFPPVSIDSQRCHGGVVHVAAGASSQFVSGLLLAAPLATGDVEVHVQGPLVSEPYVQMTCEVVGAFGISVETADGRWLIGKNSRYVAADWTIEPDASAASYFMALPAILGGRATIEGLSRRSLQGDVRFAGVLEQMGCDVQWRKDQIVITGPARTGVDVDMSNISDTAQTLAAVALFVQGPTRIRGIAHNRLKETDRIGHLATELRRLGARVVEFEDGLEIQPSGEYSGTAVPTYNDHRMAMSLSLAGLRIPGVSICNPGCVEKTYPQFFDDLDRALKRSSSR